MFIAVLQNRAFEKTTVPGRPEVQEARCYNSAARWTTRAEASCKRFIGLGIKTKHVKIRTEMSTNRSY